MRIKKAVLKNFRQYIGEQTITFSTAEDKNLTIIVGVNGAGKTNFLNAITWCFYGIEKHLVSAGPYHEILNDSIRASLKTNEISEVSVEIFLEDEKSSEEFRIFRSKKFRKIKDGLHPISEEFSAWLKEPSKEDWIDSGEPAFIVNRILPLAVEDFFIFDGERLIKFFEEETSEKVKDAILDISQISLIDTTLRHLQDKRSDLIGETRKLSPKTKELCEKRDALIKGLRYIEEQIEKCAKSGEHIEKLLKDVDRKLRGYSEERVIELQRRSEELEKEIMETNELIRGTNEDFKKLIIQDGPFALAGDALDFLEKEVKRKYKTGELPPKVREPFLKELLKKGECICGSDISKGERRQRILKKLEESSIATRLDDVTTSIRYDVKDPLERRSNFLEEKTRLGKRIKELEAKSESLNKELRDVRARLKELEIEKITSLIKQKEDYERQKNEIIGTKSRLELQKETSLTQIEEIEHELKLESRKEEKMNILNRKVEMCEQALDLLQKIREEILEEARNVVERKTFEYFHELIWKKEKFKDIKIDENYNISVIDRYNQNIIGAISAGEKEILALSFMAALSKVSGFEAPVIIDTPLARISGEHRINISECLPRYLEDVQLTLLLTDKEYEEDVRKILKPRVGVEHLLQYDRKKDETRVVKYSG